MPPANTHCCSPLPPRTTPPLRGGRTHVAAHYHSLFQLVGSCRLWLRSHASSDAFCLLFIFTRARFMILSAFD